MSHIHNSRALNTFRKARAAKKADRMLCVTAGVPKTVPLNEALQIRAARIRLAKKGLIK